MTLRTVLGFLIATTIALFARRTRSLSPSGAVAAAVVGTIAVSAGWNWGLLLIIYFAISTLLSHFGRAKKEQRTASMVAKGGERDATQVFANGVVFTLAAAAQWSPVAAGALAASTADTWATELGTLYGKQPRSILTGELVPPGTSGGVSLVGTLAAVAGAVFIAFLSFGLKSVATKQVVAVLLGGIAGAFVDTILGATFQARRWCETCRSETEQLVHGCGNDTRARRGLAWLDNDGVNLVATLAGGLLAAFLSR